MIRIQEKVAEFQQLNFVDRCEKIAFALLWLVVFGCAFTGGGHYVTIAFFTPRMLLGILCVLFSIPVFLRDWRKLWKNPVLLLFAMFLVWLAISAVRGVLAGNNREVLMSDLKGFAYLVFVPVAVACGNSRERIKRLGDAVLCGALVQAVAVLVIETVCAVWPDILTPLAEKIQGMQFGMLSNISAKIFRIFMFSSPYLIAACAIAVFRQAQSGKVQFRYAVLTALCLNALLLTFTRSLYGSAGIVAMISLVAVLILYWKNLKTIAKYLVLTVLCAAVLISGQEFLFEANLFNFALSRTVNQVLPPSFASTLKPKIRIWIEEWKADDPGPTESNPTPEEEKPEEKPSVEDEVEQEQQQQQDYLGITEVSDQLRENTKRDLKELVRKNPLFGLGLGACSATRNGVDEYFYLDMLCRTGAFGLLLYLLPFGIVLWRTGIRFSRNSRRNGNVAAILCGMAGFWVATWFNPWMNAALGIVWYAVVCALPAVPEEEIN